MTLNAYPDEHVAGTHQRRIRHVDPVTRTLQVRVVLPNGNMRIKPAMFGSIRILRSIVTRNSGSRIRSDSRRQRSVCFRGEKKMAATSVAT